MVNDDSTMPFGRFKGLHMAHVPAKYLDWLRDQEWLRLRYPEVRAYIDDNEVVIDAELREQGITGL